jgi:hypothetical protein
MLSVSVIDKKCLSLVLLFSAFLNAGLFAQENSPWSRYGLGDPVPSANIVNRGMGYVAAGYNDMQTINFVNPASYSRLGKQKAILDIGIDYHSRTMRNPNKDKVTFANVAVPYLAGAFQLKGEKTKRNWGIAFGLRPLTKVSYDLQAEDRIDSNRIIYNYKGAGGTYQAFVGTGIAIKNLSLGVNLGYRFGSKDYTTIVSLINDTISGLFTSGQKQVRNNFGGFFSEWGLQYEQKIGQKSMLTFGAFGGLSANMNVTTNETITTLFDDNPALESLSIDSVSNKTDLKGSMVYPSYWGFGFTFDKSSKSRFIAGVDFTLQNWESYRFLNKADLLQNAWQIKAGVQWMPDATGSSGKTRNMIMYRGGFLYGQEPFLTPSSNLNTFGFTIGAGIPIKKYSYMEYNRSNVINLALEWGKRGSANQPISENYFRFALSASLSDIWFIKSKYD